MMMDSVFVKMFDQCAVAFEYLEFKVVKSVHVHFVCKEFRSKQDISGHGICFKIRVLRKQLFSGESVSMKMGDMQVTNVIHYPSNSSLHHQSHHLSRTAKILVSVDAACPIPLLANHSLHLPPQLKAVHEQLAALSQGPVSKPKKKKEKKEKEKKKKDKEKDKEKNKVKVEDDKKAKSTQPNKQTQQKKTSARKPNSTSTTRLAGFVGIFGFEKNV